MTAQSEIDEQALRWFVSLRAPDVAEADWLAFQDWLEADAARREAYDRVELAWVDCDLYASTVPVLDYLTPRLEDGAVIVFDDWNCYKARPDQGERRACAEWLARNPQISLMPFRDYGWAGTSMIVHRAQQRAGQP